MSLDKKSSGNSGMSPSSDQPKRTLKGTFGHMNSRIDSKLISLNRTISAESSDLRRYIVATELGDEEMEFNSEHSTASYKDKLKDSGVEAEVNSSSLDESAELKRSPGADPPSSYANAKSNANAAVVGRLVYEFCDIDEDDLSSTAGVLDDLPSGVVDVDGTLIGKLHVRFGQEDDSEDECDSKQQEKLANNSKELERGLPLQNSCSSSSPVSELKSPTLPSPPTPNSSRRLLSKLLSRKKPMPVLSPTKQLRLDFRNRYSNNGFGTGDMVLRRHAGGSVNRTSTVRTKAGMTGAAALALAGLPGAVPMPGAGVNNNRKDSTGATITSTSTTNSTITQHYYPEGGWGYVVLFTACVTHFLLCGFLLSSGILILLVIQLFRYENSRKKVGMEHAVWLGVLSVGMSLLLSPIWVAICKRKSTRLVAVFGGLLTSLGCLFTSFASEFHQLFFSYGLFIGVGFGLTRDASSLMVGQYFKRKRELVEAVLVSSSGFGILLMAEATYAAVSSLGWRLGLQAITGFIFITFFLGTCYRSASLYHPQRRAILHLKNQKRKVKEKEKREDKPPFLDFGCLRSKTLQILLVSSAFIAFGIYTPLFHLGAHYIEQSNSDTSLLLQTNDNKVVVLYSVIGGLWVAGCVLFGLIVLQKNQDCRVSKQYLCQMASTICGVSILALTAVEGFNGLVMFACAYGFGLGAYNYTLKVYTYERVRARHFPRAWSFVQAAQAIPLVIGVPLSGYINSYVNRNYGHYLAAISIFFGSVFLFVTDFHKKTLARRKTLTSSIKTSETQESTQSPSSRRLSLAFPTLEQCSPEPRSSSSHRSHHSHHSQSRHSEGQEHDDDPELLDKELTCISEEGIADMDFQGMNYDDWNEYLGDCITSCDKLELEDCLLSEFDPEHPMLQGKKMRLALGTKRSRPEIGHHLPQTVQSVDCARSGIIGSAAVAIAGGIAGLNIQSDVPLVDVIARVPVTIAEEVEESN